MAVEATVAVSVGSGLLLVVLQCVGCAIFSAALFLENWSCAQSLLDDQMIHGFGELHASLFAYIGSAFGLERQGDSALVYAIFAFLMASAVVLAGFLLMPFKKLYVELSIMVIAVACIASFALVASISLWPAVCKNFGVLWRRLLRHVVPHLGQSTGGGHRWQPLHWHLVHRRARDTEEMTEWIKDHGLSAKKRMVGFICRNGAIIMSGKGAAKSQMAVLAKAGVEVAPWPSSSPSVTWAMRRGTASAATRAPASPTTPTASRRLWRTSTWRCTAPLWIEDVLFLHSAL